MLKFTERPKTPEMTSKKTSPSLKGITSFQVILYESGWNKGWYSSIYKEMELEIDCLKSRRLLQEICSSKCQFCSKVWAFSKADLSSSNDRWVKYKEKVPDVSHPNQNVETTCKKYPHCFVYPFLKIYNYKKEPYE